MLSAAVRNLTRALPRQMSSPAVLPLLSRGLAAAAAAPAGVRLESDTMGKVEVSNAVYWGAQTQRSLENFKIGGPAARMPIEIIRGAWRARRRRRCARGGGGRGGSARALLKRGPRGAGRAR